ncbi:MAG: hypothetical protein KatS3mg096_736 [Candidatus Parcubacteria bacterium]|nr:MAG: hypothetical protein KatS3mg096_736 [Candidatus Parcubacteria bacterium]
MKFVLITYDGHGLPIAYRLLKEGYDVLVGQAKELEHMPKEDEETKRRRLSLYDGMLEKMDADELVNKLEKETKKDDYFIFCDFNYVYPYAERLKKAGFKGLLPNEEDFKLEEDRNYAKELVRRNYDIFSEQEVIEFDSVEEAREFLKDTDKLWGVKGNNPESPTYFPASNDINIAQEDLIEILENNKKLYESGGFILEEKIEDLIEFVPEIIVNQGEILGLNINIELKPFGAGNTAWQTGDSASMIMWLKEEDWEKIIPLFFPESMKNYYLRENEMVVWDAGVMYSPSRDKFYFSEFCSDREGWSSVFNKLSTFAFVGDYFERIANKEKLFTEDVFPYGCSIRVFNEIKETKKGLEKFVKSDQRFFANLDNPNVWLWDVKMKNEKLYTVGYDHNLAVITQAGADWKICFQLIDKLLTEGKEFFYGLSYWRRDFDIINESYWGNIKQRFNFVMQNILSKEIKDEVLIKKQHLVFENRMQRLKENLGKKIKISEATIKDLERLIEFYLQKNE